MFSIIITIVAIALVTGLAIATLYYGGAALSNGGTNASASQILSQSTQVVAAAKFYESNNEGQAIGTLDALVDAQYLRNIPSADWFVTAGVVATSVPNDSVCKTLNGLLLNGHGSTVPQCSDNAIAEQMVCCQFNSVAQTAQYRFRAPAPIGLSTAEVFPMVANFGTAPVGQAGATVKIYAKNTGALPASVSTPTLVGPYSIASSTCTGTLAPGAYCNITLQFNPTTSGIISGSANLAVGGSTYTVTLNGQGVVGATPVVSFDTSILDYGTLPVGSHTEKTVTMTNTGNAAMPILSIESTNATRFLLKSTTCGSSLAAGASCQITVEFYPFSASRYSNTLKVNPGLAGRALYVALLGIGQ